MEESAGIQRHEQLLESINAVILAQQSALEILTNITCDEEAPWEEVASESGESDMIEDIEVESNDENETVQMSKIPIIVLEAIQAQDLLKKVLAKAVMPAENVQEILNSSNGRKYDGTIVIQLAMNLQSKAFLCLNNLIDVMTVEELGGCDALFEVWKNLGTLSFSTDKDQVVGTAFLYMSVVSEINFSNLILLKFSNEGDIPNFCKIG